MKNVIRVMLIILSVFSISITVKAVTPDQVNGYLSNTASYLMSHNPSPSMGSVGGEWLVMGLSRSGKIRSQYGITYRNNLSNIVKKCQGKLSERKYTEYARVVIALTAIKEDPGNFQGYNLLKPLAELDDVKRQGANGIVYGLIALDCGNYDVPKPDESYNGEITTREKLIDLILNAELEDGGWAFSGKKADADMTAMTIQALVPYYQKNEAVKKAVNNGIRILSDLQLSDGSYETGKVKTCESTAQVLTALSEMGISINDKRFVKNGKTVLDGLLQYYENGGFKHMTAGSINGMATEQAFYALTAYYRSITGKNRLYQMSDAEKLAEQNTQKGKSNFKKKETAPKKIKEKETKAENHRVAAESVEGTEEKTKSVEETKAEITSESKSKKEIKQDLESVEEVQKETESSKPETGSKSVMNQEVSERENNPAPYVGVFSAVVMLLGAVYLLRKKQ